MWRASTSKRFGQYSIWHQSESNDSPSLDLKDSIGCNGRKSNNVSGSCNIVQDVYIYIGGVFLCWEEFSGDSLISIPKNRWILAISMDSAGNKITKRNPAWFRPTNTLILIKKRASDSRAKQPLHRFMATSNANWKEVALV